MAKFMTRRRWRWLISIEIVACVVVAFLGLTGQFKTKRIASRQNEIDRETVEEGAASFSLIEDGSIWAVRFQFPHPALKPS
jgi:hypothetical protein